jgi:hypothetical protein
MDLDHSSLVKFEEGSRYYKVILGKLQDIQPITGRQPLHPTARQQWYKTTDEIRASTPREPPCTIM